MTRNSKNKLGIHKELWKSVKFWSWPGIMLRFVLCDVKFQILVSGISVPQLLEKRCITTMRWLLYLKWRSWHNRILFPIIPPLLVCWTQVMGNYAITSGQLSQSAWVFGNCYSLVFFTSLCHRTQNRSWLYPVSTWSPISGWISSLLMPIFKGLPFDLSRVWNVEWVCQFLYPLQTMGHKIPAW